MLQERDEERVMMKLELARVSEDTGEADMKVAAESKAEKRLRQIKAQSQNLALLVALMIECTLRYTRS